VVQHGHAVGSEPDVALKARRAELQRELERLDRVLGRVRTRAAMGETDGRAADRLDAKTLRGRAAVLAGRPARA